jgi:hypothetical protein
MKNNNISQLIIIFKMIIYYIIINKIVVSMIVLYHNLNNQLKIVKMIKVDNNIVLN